WLRPGPLEVTDDAAVVLGAVRIGAAIDVVEAGLSGEKLEPGLVVAEGVAIGIVGVGEGDDLVGVHPIPHRDKALAELLHAEEEHGREVESGPGFAAAREEPGLPGHDRRNAGYAVGLADIGDRIRGLRRG